ncbi:MAG TPA: prolyl oligopeptidase family serine peptidase [Acidimicrobiales bacterium]|nr:prolyl oligopeptidase family serine peptidase [Acidimicrobiales bacterium]
MGLTPPPPARRDVTTDVVHGVTVPDPYRWLEDADDPDTVAWIEASNARTRTALDADPRRPELVHRYTELFGAGAAGAPSIRGGRLFSIDRWGDLEQAVLVVRDVHGERVPAARTLVDPHALTGDATAAIDWYAPSVDGRFVAFGTSTGGDERSTLRVVEVATGELLGDAIPQTRAASVAWLPDGTAFAYTRYPDPAAVGDEAAQYDRTVWWHVLGDDPGHDELVFGDLPDRTAWPSVEMSRDGRWLLVEVSLGWTRVDVHLIDRTTGARTTVIEAVEAVSSFTIVDDHLVGTTTLDAPRGRVVAAPLTTPTPAGWSTVVAESDDVIEGVAVTRGSLLVASTRAALARLTRLPRAAATSTTPATAGTTPPATPVIEIALPEPGSLAGVAGDRDSETAVLAFTSWARPTELWRWTPGTTDLPGGPDEGLVRWSDLPSPVDPADYVVGVDRYPSTDGTEITLFTVRRAGTTPGPRTPTLLTGYGGFAVTMSPAYSPTAVAVADDGGVFAVACIRGGSEEGEDWHRAGMREHKQQVFDDFAAAADWLVAEGRTGRARLAVRGGSNGGLLVAATLAQRPDVCGAVVCAVPLTDMVRFPRFLIARLWIPEYGDPDVADEFAWLWAYSPYHHLAEGTCYPATLVLTGESDSRVDPAHARKFGAALAAATSCGDERPVLVRVESRAGHGQGKPASKQADEAADVHTFLRGQIGLGDG